MPRRIATVLVVALLAAGGGWLLFVGLPRWYGSRPVEGAAAPPPAAGGTERKITATLYFVPADGLSLAGVQREVLFGEGVEEQARRILEAQLGRAPQPLISAVPEGTALRALFLTDRGEAYVDLSGEARAKHTGGSLDEIFTIYTIVNVLTVNLPAITRVQILVEGKEVDTLAGHVDLRHPLQKNLKWVRAEDAADKDGS